MSMKPGKTRDEAIHIAPRVTNDPIQPHFLLTGDDIFGINGMGFTLTPLKKWLFFSVFLLFMLLDRVLTLLHFGFIYTDVDQVIMWNGAIDYSRGIFHQPCFYGQNYNYMLESLLAVPLLWMHIPVQIALPLITSLLSILPFTILGLFFLKRKHYFWAYLCLALPVMMPLPYNFLTTIPRGFMQAHLFIPLLFLPLFDPRSKRSLVLLFSASALCIVANQCSLLMVVPVFLFVYSYHYRSLRFYLNALWMIPVFALDYLAKYYYELHPESMLRFMTGIRIDGAVFIATIQNTSIFDHLFPFFSGWGVVYPALFLLLVILTLIRKMKKEFLFMVSLILFLLLTFSIVKVQKPYDLPNAGIFFTTGRFYLYLPLLLIISLFLFLRKFHLHKTTVYILLLLCSAMFLFKCINLKETARNTTSQTWFPVTNNSELIARVKQEKQLAEKYHVDLIVYSASDWSNYFDCYAYYPLFPQENKKEDLELTVSVSGDKRSWLYPEAEHCKQVLLNGIQVEDSLLNAFNYERLNPNQIIIKNNPLTVSGMFAKLKIKYGNQ